MAEATSVILVVPSPIVRIAVLHRSTALVSIPCCGAMAERYVRSPLPSEEGLAPRSRVWKTMGWGTSSSAHEALVASPVSRAERWANARGPPTDVIPSSRRQLDRGHRGMGDEMERLPSSIGATLPHIEVTVQVVTEVMGVPVIHVIGELDISNLDSFRAAIDPVITQGPQRLIFDFSGLRFMDSSAIALLVQLSTHIGSVEIRNPARIVRKVIEITGLADVLHLDS